MARRSAQTKTAMMMMMIMMMMIMLIMLVMISIEEGKFESSRGRNSSLSLVATEIF